jgi:hypothetical protein
MRNQDTKTYSGVIIKNRKGLNHWEPLLNEYLNLVERYCQIMKCEDVPYYYGERPNLSLLSAAAWQCGRIALEEFAHKKGSTEQEEKHGRADLWIADESGVEELIEAKWKWLCMGGDGFAAAIEKTMDEAMKDVGKTRGSTGVRAIGVSFFPLYKAVSAVENIDLLIKQTIEDFKIQDYHALAWYFPEGMRNDESHTKKIRPGFALMARNLEFDKK